MTDDLADLLSTLSPTARDVLWRVLVRDQADRDQPSCAVWERIAEFSGWASAFVGR